MSDRKDMQKLVKKITKTPHFTVERNGSNHYRVTNRKMNQSIIMSSSPGSWGAIHMAMRQLKNQLEWTPKLLADAKAQDRKARNELHDRAVSEQ